MKETKRNGTGPVRAGRPGSHLLTSRCSISVRSNTTRTGQQSSNNHQGKMKLGQIEVTGQSHAEIQIQIQIHTHTHIPGLQKHCGIKKLQISVSRIFTTCWSSYNRASVCIPVSCGVVLLNRRTSERNKSSDTTSRRGPDEQRGDLGELQQNHPLRLFLHDNRR